MRRPMQRKYAAEAEHGPRGGQGKMALPCSVFLIYREMSYDLCIVSEMEIYRILYHGRSGRSIWEYCHISGRKFR